MLISGTGQSSAFPWWHVHTIGNKRLSIHLPLVRSISILFLDYVRCYDVQTISVTQCTKSDGLWPISSFQVQQRNWETRRKAFPLQLTDKSPAWELAETVAMPLCDRFISLTPQLSDGQMSFIDLCCRTINDWHILQSDRYGLWQNVKTGSKVSSIPRVSQLRSTDHYDACHIHLSSCQS